MSRRCSIEDRAETTQKVVGTYTNRAAAQAHVPLQPWPLHLESGMYPTEACHRGLGSGRCHPSTTESAVPLAPSHLSRSHMVGSRSLPGHWSCAPLCSSGRRFHLGRLSCSSANGRPVRMTTEGFSSAVAHGSDSDVDTPPKDRKEQNRTGFGWSKK